MMKLSLFKTILVLLCGSAGFLHSQVLYTNDFSKAEIGKVPEELMVLDGQFAVQEENGNRFLELPGTPTDTYTVMFGVSTNANVGVTARVHATSKGRRMPAFAVSLNGVGGYKLQVSAAKKSIELFKGDSVVETKDFEWQSGEWTALKLTSRSEGEGVKIEGTVSQGDSQSVNVTFTDSKTINPGKASIAGTTFSGTPIRFDDLGMFQVK